MLAANSGVNFHEYHNTTSIRSPEKKNVNQWLTNNLTKAFDTFLVAILSAHFSYIFYLESYGKNTVDPETAG